MMIPSSIKLFPSWHVVSLVNPWDHVHASNPSIYRHNPGSLVLPWFLYTICFLWSFKSRTYILNQVECWLSHFQSQYLDLYKRCNLCHSVLWIDCVNTVKCMQISVLFTCLYKLFVFPHHITKFKQHWSMSVSISNNFVSETKLLIASVKSHIKFHIGVKTYPCKECKHIFSQSGDIKKNLRVHTGEKSFPCNECDQAFYNPSDLKRHTMVHTREKPYPCKECD